MKAWSHISCSREYGTVWRNEPPTLPSELPLWELESRWTPESLESDCRGQNPLDWKVLYIIQNFLECRCLKWDLMTHLDTSNTSYAKRRVGSQIGKFNSWSLKVRNWPDFLACRWRATYCWKALFEGYNFVVDFISIRGIKTKLCAPKVARVPTLGISGPPLGSSGTKWHLGVSPVATHKTYYRGKVVASPKSKLWWVLCVRGCPWFVLALKTLKLRTNQLVVWFVQVRVNNWCLFFFPSPHPRALACPSTPKVLRPRERAPTP